MALAEFAKAVRGSPVGLRTERHVLLLHYTALYLLSADLRDRAGMAHSYLKKRFPHMERAQVVRFDALDLEVAWQRYTDFDGEAHPVLLETWAFRLGTFPPAMTHHRHAHYDAPVLHHKERMVGAEFSLRPEFARLSEREEEAALFQVPALARHRDTWAKLLRSRGYEIEGHELVAVQGARPRRRRT